jgi:hypothetical protein
MAEMHDDALSRIYRRAARLAPPPALDRRVLAAARRARPWSQVLPPLALAASVLLSLAVVLAIAFGPRHGPGGDEPVRLLRAAARVDSPHLIEPRRLYTSDPPPSRGSGSVRPSARDPDAWLQHIVALRNAGRRAEAEQELRLFRAAYPSFETDPTEPAGP